jgi:hypothetical protein
MKQPGVQQNRSLLILRCLHLLFLLPVIRSASKRSYVMKRSTGSLAFTSHGQCGHRYSDISDKDADGRTVDLRLTLDSENASSTQSCAQSHRRDPRARKIRMGTAINCRERNRKWTGWWRRNDTVNGLDPRGHEKYRSNLPRATGGLRRCRILC